MGAIVGEVEDSDALVSSRESDYVSRVGTFTDGILPVFDLFDIRYLSYLLPMQEREMGTELGDDVIKNNKIPASLNIREYIDIITNLQSQIIITEFEENQIWDVKNVLDLAKIYWGLIEPEVEFEKIVEEKEGTVYFEESSLLIIVREYSKYEKVKSIYVQKYRAEIQIQILLSIDEYDDELIDNLLDTEYDIHKEFSSLTFTFFYLPVGVVEKEDTVHPEARCIFSRQKKKLWQIV